MQKTDLRKTFDEYIQECRVVTRLRPETIKGYIHAFKNFSKIMTIVRTTNDLSQAVMVDFFDKLQTRKRKVGKDQIKTGVRASTTKTYWSKLNSFFQWLERNNHVDRNPLADIKPPQPEYNDRKELTKKDFEKLIAVVNSNYSNRLLFRRDLAILYTLLFCGLRKGELLGLQVRDVDIDKKVITVRAETSKSKRDRQIPMNGMLVMHLEDYMSVRRNKRYTTEFFFVSSNRDKGLTEHGIKHWVKKMCDLSGVHFHLHMLRHTFACNLARSGVDAYTLQRLMGHTDIRMTQGYLRSMTVEDMRGAVERISIDNMA